ncbi:acyl carrier protein [Streptomyces sp. NPDC059008]|uniref:acyl carrier protein n=1 Tax=Streptomyces sp. NPDC059008 TaxID=3346693 RepID=UPI003696DEBA
MQDATEHPIPALAGVRAEVLDCVQSNLAVLADHFHGAGTHLRLGSKLSSRWWPGADGLPTVDPPVEEQLAEAKRSLGLTVGAPTTVTGARLDRLALAPGELRYALADAHAMPWLPYFGQQHMEHSFLLLAPADADGPWTVVDAYDNDTQWGAAKPGTWTVTRAELAALGRIDLHDVTAEPDPPAHPEPRIDHAPMADYLAALDQAADRERACHRLTGDTWLLARSRRLHALFAAAGRPLDEATAQHLADWDKLVTQAYMTYRRVVRGRPEPAGTVTRLAELLEADRRIFPTPAATTPEAGGLRDRVALVVGAVLDADQTLLRTGDVDLAALPGFTSFRMVEIIDRLEAQLDIELDADDLVPENLRSMDGLCRIVRGATGAR